MLHIEIVNDMEPATKQHWLTGGVRYLIEHCMCIRRFCRPVLKQAMDGLLRVQQIRRQHVHCIEGPEHTLQLQRGHDAQAADGRLRCGHRALHQSLCRAGAFASVCKMLGIQQT